MFNCCHERTQSNFTLSFLIFPFFEDKKDSAQKNLIRKVLDKLGLPE